MTGFMNDESKGDRGSNHRLKVAQRYAQDLKRAMDAAGERFRLQKSNGSSHLAVLINQCGEDEVRATLDWFVANCPSKKPPVATCQQFKDRYAEYRRAMADELVDKPVEIGEWSKDQVLNYGMYFSGKNAKNFPKMAQRTYEAIVPLHAKLVELAPTDRAAAALTTIFKRRGNLGQAWFEYVINLKFFNHETRAKITRYVFDLKSEHTDEFLAAELREYFGETLGARLWGELKEKLNGN